MNLDADFKSNWGKMVGENATFSTILFYLGWVSNL